MGTRSAPFRIQWTKPRVLGGANPRSPEWLNLLATAATFFFSPIRAAGGKMGREPLHVSEARAEPGGCGAEAQ